MPPQASQPPSMVTTSALMALASSLDQEQDGLSDLGGTGEATHGRSVGEHLAVGETPREDVLVEGRLDLARVDAHDADTVARPFDPKHVGQGDGAGLGRGVQSSLRPTAHSRHRADVEDDATTLGDHHPRCGLAAQEEALEHDAVHAVPLFLGDILGGTAGGHAGVVDEDVEPAETRHQIGDHGIDGLAVTHVHGVGERRTPDRRRSQRRPQGRWSGRLRQRPRSHPRPRVPARTPDPCPVRRRSRWPPDRIATQSTPLPR